MKTANQIRDCLGRVRTSRGIAGKRQGVFTGWKPGSGDGEKIIVSQRVW
jgi:hypothetical protein